jgi:hypothetical protein
MALYAWLTDSLRAAVVEPGALPNSDQGDREA